MRELQLTTLPRRDLVPRVPELADSGDQHVEPAVALAHHPTHHALGHSPVERRAFHPGRDLGPVGERDQQRIHLGQTTEPPAHGSSAVAR